MADQHKRFGDALRGLRESRGLAQTDLSKASGISQSTVSALETGKQRPWPSTRRALAAAFTMTLEEFDRLVFPTRNSALGPEEQLMAGSEAVVGKEASEAYARSLMRLVDQYHLTQDRLRRSELELGLIRRLIDEMPVLSWATGEDLRVHSASGWAKRRHEVWLDLVGRTIPEFQKRTCGRVPIPPLEPHHAALEGRSVSVIVDWDGQEWTVALEPIRDGRDKVTGVLGLAVLRV